jgi:hypothetical protein
MEWFRFYSEMMHDRKIRRMTPEQRWVWVAVLSLASQSPVRGRLLMGHGIQLNSADIADEAAVPERVVVEALEVLQAFCMIHLENSVIVVTKWEKRQFASDNATTRTSKHRDNTDRRSEDVPVNNGGTVLKRSEDVPVNNGGTVLKRSEDVPVNNGGTAQSQKTEHRIQSQNSETHTDTESDAGASDAGALVSAAAGRESVKPTDGFDSFWAAYPVAEAKDAARKAWRSLAPDPELQERVLAGIERAKLSDRWQRGMIPFAGKWLTDRRWEDEFAPPLALAVSDPQSRARNGPSPTQTNFNRPRSAAEAAPPLGVSALATEAARIQARFDALQIKGQNYD